MNLGMVFLALLFAPNDPELVGDRKALLGTWKIVQFQDDGIDRLNRLTGSVKNDDPASEKAAKVVFTATDCYVLRPTKMGTVRDIKVGLTSVAWQGYTLDEKAMPKAITLTVYSDDPKKPPIRYPGIYEISGTKLKICWNESGKPDAKRPTTFVSDADMNLLVCERLSDTPERPTVSEPK